MNDQITSYIRTATPSLVGALIAYLASKRIVIDPTLIVPFTAFLTALFTILYYFIVRQLERQNANFGWLLGIAKQPIYTMKGISNETQKTA